MNMSNEVYNATLIKRYDLTDEMSVVQVRPDDGVPDFKPGQFVTVGLPKDQEQATGSRETSAAQKLIRRAYSIATSPVNRDYLELFVMLVRGGRLTPRLWTVEEGGRLYLDPRPKGKFTLDSVPPGKDLVMVATGTGLSPYVSMWRTHKEDPPWRRMVVIHGVRKASDLAFRNELEHDARVYPHFNYLPIVSRPENGWAGLTGRVQQVLHKEHLEELMGVHLDPQQCHVFLCGNPDMINEVTRLLERYEFRPHSRKQPGTIHLERYW
jgi:ferredoxin--NADP+ reductase